jgi:hypothetical protein
MDRLFNHNGQIAGDRGEAEQTAACANALLGFVLAAFHRSGMIPLVMDHTFMVQMHVGRRVRVPACVDRGHSVMIPGQARQHGCATRERQRHWRSNHAEGIDGRQGHRRTNARAFGPPAQHDEVASSRTPRTQFNARKYNVQAAAHLAALHFAG